MNKYIFPIVCLLVFSTPLHAQQNTQDQSFEYYMKHYMFDEAEELVNQNIKKLKRRRKPTTVEEEQLQEISKLRSVMRATERITIIDSFVVDKSSFLKYIKLTEESGTLHNSNEFFSRPGATPCTVYQSEIGNKIYFSQPDGNQKLRLYTSDLIGDKWAAPQLINELEGDEAQNYPFMLSDGITLYYAAQGSESLGGYDIFVTRYDMDEKKFLYPENIGMPFNSTANDYMFAIDEFSRLGWFASDRNQPENKVCIYVFIPNDIRKLYDSNIYTPEELARLALICSIAETWGDKEAVAAARHRLQQVLNTPQTVKQQKEIEFVINNQHTYYFLKDFKSPDARKKWKHGRN